MRFKVTVLLIFVALFVAACGGSSGQEVAPTAPASASEPTEAAAEAPTAEAEATANEESMVEAASMIGLPDPLAVSGNIVSAGSSTVFPLAERIAERYQNEGFSGDITIDSIGSGAGFERFCVAAETDVSNASRAIRASEVASCNENGRYPIEFRVGTDALAVVVSQENDFLTDATFEELVQIFGTASNWSDVNPDWPDEPIQRFIPGTDSGTFDYFTEAVFEEDPEPQLSATNVQLSEDDNVLVQGVAGSPNAVGYFGYAYAAENTDILHPIMIEGVEPNNATVDANEYPLARPLFIYSDGNIMMEKPQVADYINFFLTYVDEEISDVGYFPASDEALNAARDKWVAAMSGEGESVAESAEEEAPAEEEMAMVELPVPDPLAVSGNIVSAGSSTVFPLAERIAERYQNEGFAGDITIDSIGSGAGYERFCVAAETDVSNASRAIRDTEIESCRANGREPIEFRVGTDALAVVVSQENDFLTDATFEELVQIFGTASNWSDVNPDWPDEPIQRFIPGTDSGTFDYFTEAVFEEDPEPQLSATNVQLSEDDNVLVQGVAGSPNAVGYFGYAYAAENTDILHPIMIEGVEPNNATVDANEYPLARPLFIYSDAGIMGEKPQVADYINFFLTYVNEEILDVGYFPASDEALNQSREKWLEAMGQ
ncbi:MAG: PstS family phosphate ABC transporter substrate-binding protein [Candidatus Promineifilaceae bacterium]